MNSFLDSFVFAANSFADALSAAVFFTVSVGGAQFPLVVLWLIIGACFFTVYLKFINLRGFRHSIDLVNGKYEDKNAGGEVSQFQALCTAVCGTVGIGNIAGVAVAISIGGAGATFWMIVAGLLSMSTKFVECSLSVKYREYKADGSVRGGPMYYLKYGLAELGMPKLGSALGIFYAVGIIFGAMGAGNMFQSNQVFEQVSVITNGMADGYGWLVGLILAATVALVIVGGIKSIARVAQNVVPSMVVLYCTFSLIVIFVNFEYVPQAIENIFVQAFSGGSVAGGMVGALIVGVQRAVFSCEAGIGTAAIAHSSARTDQPISEGTVSLLEPFLDTVVICTMTGLVIGTTLIADPLLLSDKEGVSMTSAAFANIFSWFPYLLLIIVILFAFTTIIAWSYYGLLGWVFLFGESSQAIYKWIYCAGIVIGCIVQLEPVLKVSDALIFLICIPNILGMLFLVRKVKVDMQEYYDHYLPQLQRTDCKKNV